MIIDIFKADWFLQPQLDYLLLLQHFRVLSHGVLDEFFLFITKFGEWSLAVPIVACFYWAFSSRGGAYILFTSAFSGIINQCLKMTACIYRPWILNSDIKPVAGAMEGASGYSFPSGHTDRAITIWGGFTILNWKNIVLRLLFIVIFVLVAFSRNYLGVHTLQDVFASTLIGLFMLFLSKKLLIWVEEKQNRDIIVLVFGYILVASILLFIHFKSYHIDYVGGKILVNPFDFMPNVSVSGGYTLGILSGLFLCRRFIPYDASSGTVFVRILKCIFGLLGLFVLSKYTPVFFINLLGKNAGLLANYFLFGLFITAIYPLLIKTVTAYFDIFKNRINKN